MPESSPIIDANNRSFKYGDNLFETIAMYNHIIPFLNWHFNRLVKGMHILQINIPDYFSIAFFEKHIQALALMNKTNGNAVIRLTVFRKGAGRYMPESQDATLLISVKIRKENHFKLINKGLHINFFTKIKKPINCLSNLKHGNALLYILAALEQKQKKLDECILLNENGNVVEAISSSIFILKNKELITVPLSEGGVDSIMRKAILNIKNRLNTKNNLPINLLVVEKIIKPLDLLEADEIWLTNAVSGIQWVGQLGTNRSHYGSQIAAAVVRILNEVYLEGKK